MSSFCKTAPLKDSVLPLIGSLALPLKMPLDSEKLSESRLLLWFEILLLKPRATRFVNSAARFPPLNVTDAFVKLSTQFVAPTGGR